MPCMNLSVPHKNVYQYLLKAHAIQYDQEPIAFFGGVFAGFFGLSLSEGPLRSWIQRTGGSEDGVSRADGGSSTACVKITMHC